MRTLRTLLTFVLILAVVRSLNGVPPLTMQPLLNEIQAVSDTIYTSTMFGKALKNLQNITNEGNGFEWEEGEGLLFNISRNVKNIGNAIRFYFYTIVFTTGTMFVDCVAVCTSLMSFFLNITGISSAPDYNPNGSPAENEEEGDSRPWWWFFVKPIAV